MHIQSVVWLSWTWNLNTAKQDCGNLQKKKISKQIGSFGKDKKKLFETCMVWTMIQCMKCYLPQPLTLLDIIYYCSLICIHVILPWLSCHVHLSIFPYDQDGLYSCEDINWLHGIWKAMQWRPGVNWNPLPPGKFLPKEKSGQLANPDSQKWQNSTK